METIFKQLCRKYSNDDTLIDRLWIEISANYSHKSRHYHSLTHLQNMYRELLEVEQHVEDWDIVLFALFYHDVIYDSKSKKNEDKSAELAQLRLKELGVSNERIKRCTSHILLTKGHNVSDDGDSNIFTDADLSILGQEWDKYIAYAKNIRKEYRLYPDIIYKPGRKKVLIHFLNMDRIFKSDHFHDKFETRSRENLERELNILKGQ